MRSKKKGLKFHFYKSRALFQSQVVRPIKKFFIARASINENAPRCSYCLSESRDVNVLFSAEPNFAICDECIVHCLRYVRQKEYSIPKSEGNHKTFSLFDRIISESKKD